MDRRNFIKSSLFVTGGVITSSFSKKNVDDKKYLKLTVLHTNDTHSNIDPMPPNHPQFPNMGGVVWRNNLIKKIKSEEKNVLLLDAGDIFQGTPYFNKYKGLLEMKLMSQMEYDASTMGNHDFDIGLEGFKNAKEYASFPFICSNYDFSKTILKDDTIEHLILKKDKLKIGILGLGVELEGLVSKNNYGNCIYLDPIEIANKKARMLKDEGCNFIICLSHLGFEYSDTTKISDKILARNTKNIDVIIGGHTHTFLDSPVKEINLDNKSVIINQVGWAGVKLGRMDFYFSKDKL
jgi:5'-nucleotidase